MLFFFLIYCRFNYLSRIRGLLNCSGPILLPFLASWLLQKNKKEKKVHENIANLGRIGLLHFYDTQIKCCILTAQISHKKRWRKRKRLFDFWRFILLVGKEKIFVLEKDVWWVNIINNIVISLRDQKERKGSDSNRKNEKGAKHQSTKLIHPSQAPR